MINQTGQLHKQIGLDSENNTYLLVYLGAMTHKTGVTGVYTNGQSVFKKP